MPNLQAPRSIFLIRPAAFGYNVETASTNRFQVQLENNATRVSEMALLEFDTMVKALKDCDIDMLVFEDTLKPPKPDAIFPNNWISLHEDGTLVLYPMMASNRRVERRADIINELKDKFNVNHVLTFEAEEQNERIVEGTGSLVFDYVNKIAFACRSGRTNESLATEICAALSFTPIFFDAVDELGIPVYHTNVVMCMGSEFATICLDAIKNDDDQERILDSLARTNHKVIAISYEQMKSFAGNMMEVVNRKGEPVVLLSQTAFNSLLPGQIDAISRHADLLPLSIPTIEKYGGGSVRCMVAGIFASKK
jgi:hypothetical protein